MKLKLHRQKRNCSGKRSQKHLFFVKFGFPFHFSAFRAHSARASRHNNLIRKFALGMINANLINYPFSEMALRRLSARAFGFVCFNWYERISEIAKLSERMIWRVSPANDVVGVVELWITRPVIEWIDLERCKNFTPPQRCSVCPRFKVHLST